MADGNLYFNSKDRLWNQIEKSWKWNWHVNIEYCITCSLQNVTIRFEDRQYIGLFLDQKYVITYHGQWYWSHVENIFLETRSRGLAQRRKNKCHRCIIKMKAAMRREREKKYINRTTFVTTILLLLLPHNWIHFQQSWRRSVFNYNM